MKEVRMASSILGRPENICVHLTQNKSNPKKKLEKHYKKPIRQWMTKTCEQTPLKTKKRVYRLLMNAYDSQDSHLCLRDFRLRSVPPFFGLTHLTDLHINGNKIDQVDLRIFSELRALQILDLSRNSIKDIVNQDLSDHPNLTILHLDNNKITTINHLNLSFCTQLKSLHLELNPYESIRNIDLSYCKQLSTFILNNTSYLELRTMENINLSNCPSLTKISINYTSIERFGHFDFTNSDSIQYISLGRHKIDSFPEWDVSHLMNLTEVYLISNRLSTIDEKLFSIMPRLLKLDLSYNQFLELSETVLALEIPSLRVRMSNNLFSPNRVADINARQNMPTYQGPRFTLSIHNILDTHDKIVDLDKILKQWNRSYDHIFWQTITLELEKESRTTYNNLAIFLYRLYNETPRANNGDIPEAIRYHVNIILDALEDMHTDNNWIKLCCEIAQEYIETCGDKLGIGLIYLSLECQKKQALKSKKKEAQLKAEQDLNWLKTIILFIRNINEYKIVYDKKSKTFQNLIDISDGETKLYGDRVVTVNEMLPFDRELVITKVKDKRKYDLVNIFIGDEVEDVLMLLNKLKTKGVANIDAIDIRFRSCITLKDPVKQTAALDYLIKNYSD